MLDWGDLRGSMRAGRSTRRRGRLSAFVLGALMLLTTAPLGASVAAATGDIGFEGPSFAGSGSAPTG